MTELTDGEFTLRAPRAEDAEQLATALERSKDDVSRWLEWDFTDYRKAASAMVEQTLARSEEYLTFYVFDLDGTFLGSVGLNGINVRQRVAYASYWIRSDRTRAGIAPRALRLVAKHGFDELGLQRIEIFMEPENVASALVAEKAGAHFEGIWRRRIPFNDGHNVDARGYSLIPSDLEL